MQQAECLRRVRPLVRERVPTELREFQWESFSFQSKLWYGNKALHYEIWPRERLGTIEIGLHFEADPLTNARLLPAFAANAKAIRRALRDARIEEWDRGWSRVWEPLPHRKPDEALVTELAERIAAYVTALEPILRRELPSDVAWTEPAARPAGAKAARGSRATRVARH
jgi:hypothetical protein